MTLIGVDEVGRGCLAGPVVAAAVLLAPAQQDAFTQLCAQVVVRDSKTMSPAQRTISSAAIRDLLSVGIGICSAEEIDTINIRQATLRAMRAAVKALSLPDYSDVLVRVDGRDTIPQLDLPQEAIIAGDARDPLIAAASIIAKEYRDTLMEELDGVFPAYGFARHKGYGTAIHRAAIAAHGLTPHHRRTFCH